MKIARSRHGTLTISSINIRVACAFFLSFLRFFFVVRSSIRSFSRQHSHLFYSVLYLYRIYLNIFFNRKFSSFFSLATFNCTTYFVIISCRDLLSYSNKYRPPNSLTKIDKSCKFLNSFNIRLFKI